MDETDPAPAGADLSRRGVLLALGAAAVAVPVVPLVRGGGRASAGTGGLRFTVRSATRLPAAGHRGVRHPGAESWPDLVRIRLDVLNTAASSLLVSPGQFRLRVVGSTGGSEAGDGRVTVMPTAWEHAAQPLGPGASRTGWIDYRAPSAPGLVDLEFTAAGWADPVAVPLTALLAVR